MLPVRERPQRMARVCSSCTSAQMLTPGLAVSAVDRMANVFKNMGRVDFEKECKELRVKLQACEDAVATKVPLSSMLSRSAC